MARSSRRTFAARSPLPSVLSIAPFLAASSAWNFALGMTYVLVPLYARSLGFSGMAIGSLVSLPILLQVVLNLLGGAYTDRIGGKQLAIVACAFGIVAGLIYSISDTLAGLMAAQFAWIVSRAVFWPSTWAMAAELPGDRSRRFGTLNAITSLAQIAGTSAAGLLVQRFDFHAGFGVFTAVALFATVSIAVFAAPPRKPAPPQPLFANYGALLRRRAMHFGILCAFISALPFSLSMSFYPILMVEIGFSTEEAGWLLAVRGLGAAAAGVVAGRFVRSTAEVRWPLIASTAVGVSVIFVATFPQPSLTTLFLLSVGLGSAIMTLYFQILMSDLSTPQERGSAMALGGMGWSLSHFSTPLIMGALTDIAGIVPAFYVMGAIASVWGLALVPVHRWVFRAGHSA
jgi:predicted MFS family arabinose efflux permease